MLHLELARQQAESGRPFTAPIESLVSVFMRHCFRDSLAVCMDWQNDFGAYRRLTLGSDDILIALVGPVKRQPAYSASDPQHAAVIANDVWFEGQAVQYVIDFTDPRNQPWNRRVSAPILL